MIFFAEGSLKYRQYNIRTVCGLTLFISLLRGSQHTLMLKTQSKLVDSKDQRQWRLQPQMLCLVTNIDVTPAAGLLSVQTC